MMEPPLDLVRVVPASWFALVGGILIACFVWWLKREFERNDREHHVLQQDHRNLHAAIVRVHRRVDHMMDHLNIPRFRDPPDEDEKFDPI